MVSPYHDTTVEVFLITFSETVIVGNCFTQIINITVVATIPYYIRNNPDNYVQSLNLKR